MDLRTVIAFPLITIFLMLSLWHVYLVLGGRVGRYAGTHVRGQK